MDTSIIALRQAYLMDTLGPFIVRNNSTNDWALFEDPTTPQAKALQWMVEEDTFSSDPTSMEFQTLLERYALAVLSLSTNLPSIRPDLHFMDPTRSVCDWNNGDRVSYYIAYSSGVFCHGDSAANQTATTMLFRSLQMRGTIPWEISLLEDVNYVDFSVNGLKGTLPPELLTMPEVERIWLGANKLSGTLPSMWGDSTPMLTGLDLSSNRFEGTIPSEMLNSNSLQFFFLQDNLGLSGSIPTEVGLMSHLTELDLSNCHLSGTLPSEFAKLSSLERLWIFGNLDLTGMVPVEFSSMSLLYQFRAFNTSLTGSLDAVFCLEDSAFREDAVFYHEGIELRGGYKFDCLGPEPEIECSCCFTCCDADGDNCENAYLTWTTWPPDGAARIVRNPFWLLQLLVHGLLSLWMFAL